MQSAFAVDDCGLFSSQIATANPLINAHPQKTSQIMPSLAVELLYGFVRLDDEPIKRRANYFRCGLVPSGSWGPSSTSGSTPPLEGGGIFQAGLNYGGGIGCWRVRRWMIRMDYRETLTSQPDLSD